MSNVDLKTAIRLAHAAYLVDLLNESDNPNINDQDSDARAASAASHSWLQDNGWRFLTSAEVPGLFDSGLFVSENGFGAALLAVKEEPGNNTIAIAFRGTNDVVEASGWWTSVSGVFGRVPESWGDHYYWANRSEHYQLFSELFESLVRSINEDFIDTENDEIITNIFVTGHSLGASMAEYFISEFEFGLAALSVSGINFATPGTGPKRSEFQDASRLFTINLSEDAISAATFFSNRAGEFREVFIPLNATHSPTEIHSALSYLGVALAIESIGLSEDEIRERDAELVLHLDLNDSVLGSAFGPDRNSRIRFSESELIFQPILLSQAFQSTVFTPDGPVSVQSAPIRSPIIVAAGRGNDSVTGREFGDLLFGLDGIDKLYGLGGDDTLHGGGDDDTLIGGHGDDTLYGGDGDRDVAVFTGSAFDYDVDRQGDDIIVRYIGNGAGDGTDTLRNIEIIRFEDGRELDATVQNLEGFTRIDVPSTLVEASGTRLASTWTRSGDTDYAFTVLEDGEVVRSDRLGSFIDSQFTAQADQTAISRGVRVLDGSAFITDELLRVEYKPVDDGGLAQSVLFFMAGSERAAPFSIDYLATGDDGVDTRGGRAFGDPHLITLDNAAYDFMAAGEFVLARATSGAPLEVQARFAAISSAVSVTEAVALDVGGVVVSVQRNGTTAGSLLIDGVATTLSEGEALALGGAGSVSRDGRVIAIDNGEGDRVEISVFGSFLNVTVAPSLGRTAGSIEGLLGNADGSPSNDFQLADGTVLSTPVPVDVLYGAFAESWAIAPADSLLPGEPLAFDAPDRILTVDSLPAGLRAQAEAAVDAVGITNPILREAAILDFALTGNTDFIEAARETDNDFDPIVDIVTVDPVANPVILLTADRTALQEGDPAAASVVLTVSRGDASGEIEIDWSVTSISGLVIADDFVGQSLAGSVLIADGEEEASFTLILANDGEHEANEVFDLQIALSGEDAARYEILQNAVRLTVAAEPNAAPEAEDDSATTAFQTAVEIGALANDSDPDGDQLSLVAVTQGSNGAVAIDDRGTVSPDDDVAIYTPGAGFSGEDSFEYTVADGFGGETTATVTVIVTEAQNGPPTASPINADATSENGANVKIDLLADAGASDPDGDLLVVADVSVVDDEGASVAFVLVGATLRIDPAQFADALDAGETTTLTVAYAVTDGHGGVTPNSATLVVEGLDGPFTWYLDDDGDGFGIDDPATNLTAYAAPAGTSDVARDADDADDTVFPGALEINDGKDNDQDGEIDEDNRAPVAESESFEVAEDGALTVAAATLLANDTDADGDTLTVTGVSNPVNGLVSLDDKGDADASNDDVIFTPAPGFTGAASFDYTVADGVGGEATATVTVTVTEATEEPQSFSIAAGPSTVVEGDAGARTLARFTIARDSVAGAALVTLTRFGDSDSADASDPPASVAFEDGEAFVLVDVDIFGDADVEADETYGLEIVAVDRPATVEAERAETLILNDDAPPSAETQQVIVWAAGTAFQGDPTFDLYVNGALTQSDIAVPSGPGPLPASERDAATKPFVFDVDATIEVESVGVAFRNDRWRGTPETDRNLFVSKVEFGGETYTVAEHGDFTPTTRPNAAKEQIVERSGAMYWNGELEFAQRQIVTVFASGENYLGNPKFDLLINGDLVATGIEVVSNPGMLPFNERETVADAFRFKADADLEIESVGVRFRNDRYAGERDLDRNLFIPKIEIDGRELRPDTHAEFFKAHGENSTLHMAADKYGHLFANGTLVFEVDDLVSF